MSGTGNGSSGENGGQTTDATKPATNISEAQKNEMLTKTINSEIEDAKGNKITIPAGFKIKVDEDTNNATTVDKGIVVIDSKENEFVWIPVGTITKSDGSKVEINLNRYTFDSNGVATPQGDTVISSLYQELTTSTYGNTTAKDIEGFKASVIKNGGYYIGRYEARTATERSSNSDNITTITEKGTDYVYNYVTQPQAVELARNMYKSSNFTSDLINSYAWDTATLFLQNCGTNSTYSRKTSVNTSLVTTGTNNQTTKDVQCNVYDMASNIFEWTTETCSYSSYPCVSRGGSYFYSNVYTSYRGNGSTSVSNDGSCFRPLLYL